MVAILSCGPDDVDTLDRRSAFKQSMDYSEAWRAGTWQGKDTHLALLVDERTGAVRWLARARAGRQVTSRDRAVMLSEVSALDEEPSLQELRQALPVRHREAVRARGVLSPPAGEAVVNALLSLLAFSQHLVERLSRPTATIPRGRRGELLNQERDATGMLLEFEGIDRTALRDWQPSDAADVPFLAGLPEYNEREDALIAHDVELFSDWTAVPNRNIAWRTFTDGPRRMHIMNANRTPVEHTTGVDVVYHNEARNAFVLIQYKRMTPDRSGTRKELFYRPDGQLALELERLGRIDELCRDQPGEFRLSSSAGWLKLCDPDPRTDDPRSLIKGMYFAREHFLELLEMCKGPKGGPRIGYSNVTRYLNNTEFTGLVRDGWIGSRGVATEEIARLIRESLATGHAVVVGVSA